VRHRIADPRIHPALALLSIRPPRCFAIVSSAHATIG
jgi:hypothetical protein